jgi:hypothetical protein
MINPFKALLQISVFPFIIVFSIIQSLVAKPFHFNHSKVRGLEIGIVPLLAIIAFIELINHFIRGE